MALRYDHANPADHAFFDRNATAAHGRVWLRWNWARYDDTVILTPLYVAQMEAVAGFRRDTSEPPSLVAKDYHSASVASAAPR